MNEIKVYRALFYCGVWHIELAQNSIMYKVMDIESTMQMVRHKGPVVFVLSKQQLRDLFGEDITIMEMKPEYRKVSGQKWKRRNHQRSGPNSFTEKTVLRL